MKTCSALPAPWRARSRLARARLAMPWVSSLVLACTPGSPVGTGPKPPPTSDSFRTERPPPGEPSRLVYPTPNVRTEQSGVTTLALHRPASTVALGLSVKAGSLHDPEGQSGLAVLTAHTLAEETARLSARDLVLAIEDLGTSLSVSVSRDGVSFGMELLPEDLPRGLALLGELSLRPGLREDSFQRVKERMQQAQISERQSAQRLASLAGLRAVLGPRLGAPVWGSMPDVKTLTLADVERFYRSRYRPSEIAVVAVGAISASELSQHVEAALTPLMAVPMRSRDGLEAPPPRTPTRPSVPGPSPTLAKLGSAHDAAHQPSQINVESVAAKRPLHVVNGHPGQAQSAVFVGAPLPPRGQPGDAAREVMVNLLGGLFSSRLNQKLRKEHGFTYGVRAFIVESQSYGLLGIVTSVESAHTAAALGAIVNELGALQGLRPALPEETYRARLDLNHYLLSSLEHVARIESDLVDLFLESRHPTHFSDYQTAIASVTATQVTAQAQQLHPTDLRLVIVGDSDALRAQFSGTPWRLEPAPQSWTE